MNRYLWLLAWVPPSVLAFLINLREQSGAEHLRESAFVLTSVLAIGVTFTEIRRRL